MSIRKRPPLRPHEIDLLSAVDRSLPAEAAIDAWRRWAAAVDIDEIDAGTFELLPRLQRRIEELGDSVAGDHRISGTYRLSWARNQPLLIAAADLARKLRDAEIQTTALCGTWIGFDGASDRGGRPLREAALAVHPADAEAAIAVLDGPRWTADPPDPQRRLGQVSSIKFHRRDSDRIQVRLWYRVPTQILGMQRLMARSARVIDDELAVSVPSRDDRLIELCMEGMSGQPQRRLAWIADAQELLADHAAVSWPELLTNAGERRIAAHIRSALIHLNSISSGTVPEHVICELDGIGSTLSERAAMWGRARDSGPLRAFALGCDQHRRYRHLGPQDPLGRPRLLDSLRQRHTFIDLV